MHIKTITKYSIFRIYRLCKLTPTTLKWAIHDITQLAHQDMTIGTIRWLARSYNSIVNPYSLRSDGKKIRASKSAVLNRYSGHSTCNIHHIDKMLLQQLIDQLNISSNNIQECKKIVKNMIRLEIFKEHNKGIYYYIYFCYMRKLFSATLK